MTNDNLELKKELKKDKKVLSEEIAKMMAFIVVPITWGQVFLWMAILGG